MIGFLNLFGIGEKLHLPLSLCSSAMLKAHLWGTHSCSGGQWKLGQIKVIKGRQINTAFILDLLAILGIAQCQQKDGGRLKWTQIWRSVLRLGKSHRIKSLRRDKIIISERRDEEKFSAVVSAHLLTPVWGKPLPRNHLCGCGIVQLKHYETTETGSDKSSALDDVFWFFMY